MERKKTVGALALEVGLKEPETRDPVELERAMHKDYEKNIFQCLERAQKSFPFKDIFIVVETKKERKLNNVVRNLFFFRLSCPTPNYDHAVYHYKHADDSLSFLWVIPSRDTCMLMKDNVLHIAPEERELLSYVLDFSDGTLMKKCKVLNGEMEASPLIAV